MNYYDELIDKINKLINAKQYDEARSLILNELNLPYVPSDIETKLKDYMSIINEATKVYKSLSEEDIEAYLYKDNDHQILAVDELDKRNLRDYIDICNKYLKSDGYKNAKVLLIDSLIRQEINHEFDYVNNGSLLVFNPINLLVIEKTEGYISAYKIISNKYMKEPSLFKMANDLLYKECLLYLPKQANTQEGEICANKIIKYIDDAFKAA